MASSPRSVKLVVARALDEAEVRRSPHRPVQEKTLPVSRKTRRDTSSGSPEASVAERHPVRCPSASEANTETAAKKSVIA